MGSHFLLLILTYLALLQLHNLLGAVTSSHTQDPTHGFTSLALNSSDFKFDKPYDLPVGSRYSFVDGVHKLWVLSSDKPLSKGSPTAPRSEIHIKAYVPDGTSGVCIMQIFGANHTNTTLMLTVYDGALMYYRRQLVADDIYGRWFRLNVIHDMGTGKVKVFIDGALKLAVNDRGGKSRYFKFGVYSQKNDSSYFKESLWKEIKVLKLSH